MAKLSITNGQFERMRAAICKVYGEAACALDGHRKCRKAADAAFRELKRDTDAQAKR